jgi:hypothetical protein
MLLQPKPAARGAWIGHATSDTRLIDLLQRRCRAGFGRPAGAAKAQHGAPCRQLPKEECAVHLSNVRPARQQVVVPTQLEMQLIRSRHWHLATWLLVVAACQSDSPAGSNHPRPPAPTGAAQVTVISGDGQHADPLDDLPEPVRFQVVDSATRGLAGVTVVFAVPIGGGSLDSTRAVTDSNGVVQALWTMGPLGGIQTLEAHVGSRLLATATATTCDPSDCFPSENLSSSLTDATVLDLATYEGSGQAVHPSVVRGHRSATGFWLAITPYPGGNSLYENPSIFRSRDAHSWIAPAGVSNPIVHPDATGYLSDPSIVVNSDQHLWMYYRDVINQQNVILLTRSTNGRTWDAPTTVVTAPSHQVVSPSVVRGAPQAPWQMWSVNSGTPGCSAPVTTVERRTSPDGLNWSEPLMVELDQPGQAIWHIDVHWIPARAEYWALYNTYPIGTSCATNALYLARSPDGIRWTVYPSPIARAGVIAAFKDVIYKSTFMVDPRATRVTLWMSGASYLFNVGYDWRTATVATSVSDLLAIAAVPSVGLQALPFRKDLPPPEPDVGP